MADVQVQSGIGLGLKMFAGFLLGGLMCFGGTCVACGSCSAASILAARSSAEEEKRQVSAYLSKVSVSTPRVFEDGLHRWVVSGEVTNGGDRALATVMVRVHALGQDGTAVVHEDIYPVDPMSDQPLKPGASRGFGLVLDAPPSNWAKKVNVVVEEVQFALR